MRLIAFDTSLLNLGYAYGYIQDGKLYVECVGTFDPDSVLKQIGHAGWDVEDDTLRMRLVRDFVLLSSQSYLPDCIILERPYFNGRNPKSLMSQSKALGVIDESSFLYNTTKGSGIHTTIYQPIYIKQSVGVKSTEFKDKIGIDRAIERRLEDGTLVYLNVEDEPQFQKDHGNDAVAMIYTKYKEIVESTY